MKVTKQPKEYNAPQFQLVKQEESNKVFFTASGPTPTKAPGASLAKINNW